MINYDLTKIKALAFDVDGVLSTNNVYLSDDGDGLTATHGKHQRRICHATGR